jgi:hypothetical protein
MNTVYENKNLHWLHDLNWLFGLNISPSILLTCMSVNTDVQIKFDLGCDFTVKSSCTSDMSLAATLFLLNLSRHMYLVLLLHQVQYFFSHREFASTRRVHDSCTAQESNRRNSLHLYALVLELNTQWLLLKAGIYVIAEQGRPLNFISLTWH